MTIGADSTTLELLLEIDGSEHDRLIAELDLLGFEAFLQEDHALRAYAPFDAWTPELKRRTEALLAGLALPVEPSIRFLPPENWNEEWERSIGPVVVGPFVITPSWRENEAAHEGLIRLEIDPKMSFGTGYHPTTRLMLRMLPDIVEAGNRVLDAGTGTGILAIAAARLGASDVLGIDVDPWSERNARENCLRNGVSDVVEIRLSSIERLTQSSFDVIMANIQLDVIVASLDRFESILAGSGCLLVSGILVRQAGTMAAGARRSGLAVTDTKREGDWWAGALRRG